MAKKSKEKKEITPARRGLRRLFLGGVILMLIVLAALAAYSFYYQHKILPHTQVAGVSVGGMTKEQADAAVSQKEQSFLTAPLSVSYAGQTWNLKPTEVKLSFANQAAIDQVYGYGKTGGFWTELRQQLRALFLGRYAEVDLLSLNSNNLTLLHDKILKKIEVVTSETSLQFAAGKVTIVPGKAGKQLDQDRFETDMYQAFKTGGNQVTLNLRDFQPQVTTAMAELTRQQATQLLAADWQVSANGNLYPLGDAQLATWLGTEPKLAADGQVVGLSLTVNPDLLQKYVGVVAAEVDKKPVNAQLKGANGAVTVTVDAQPGLQTDQAQTAAAIKNTALTFNGSSPRVIAAVTAVSPAVLSRDTLGSLGIKELIGSATTDFSGSPTNRRLNIIKGESSLNGGVVKDGETYSTVGSLGPIEESTGYLPELVIINNRTIPQAGGGLCQVSTTLFRAVLNAGLPVVERTNHAYRVGYYERGVGPGLDATVYDPSPDFKWRNDTGSAIYIQSYVTGNTVTFELYGTKDGRSSVISAPQILENIPVGDPIYANSDTLFKGETKQVETAHAGAKTLVTYTVTRNGEKINYQEFRSYYQPWPAQYLVGTKDPLPTPTPSPTPTPDPTPTP